MKKAALSIVIVTFDRPLLLARCLKSLAVASSEYLKTCPDFLWEVKIGLNGADQESQKLIGQFDHKLLTLFEFSVRINPSEVRNILIEKCKAPWVYFIDDDAFVDPNFFCQFSELSRSFPDASVIGGPNLTPDSSTTFQLASGMALKSYFGTLFSAPRYASLGQPRYCGEESLILCNLFVKKKVLHPSSFPKDFLCCEENWLLRELESKNHKFIYAPGLSVWHVRRSNIILFGRQVFNYGFGRGQILKRNPQWINLAHLIPTVFIFYILFVALAFAFFSPSTYWLIPIMTYFTLSLASAIFSRRDLKNKKAAPLATLWSSTLFPVIHTSYGWGMLVGFVKG